MLAINSANSSPQCEDSHVVTKKIFVVAWCLVVLILLLFLDSNRFSFVITRGDKSHQSYFF